MANDVTSSFRASSVENLDNLANRKRSIEVSIRTLEDEHRDTAEANRRAEATALADALAPLEDDLRDINNAIYAQERMLGALPPSAPRFQERQDTAAPKSIEGQAIGSGVEKPQEQD